MFSTWAVLEEIMDVAMVFPCDWSRTQFGPVFAKALTPPFVHAVSFRNGPVLFYSTA